MIRTAKYIIFTAFVASVLFAPAQEQAPLASALRVESTPAGAELHINRQGPFTTPYVTTDLNPGTHLITVRARGFKTHRQTITLAADERVPLNVELQPLTGLVLIHTVPEGVEVKVNNLNKGSTPLLLTDLTMGQHTVHFGKSGYMEKTIDLTITDRAPVHIRETLTPSSATLVIESIPSDARITLNGSSHGTTPATIDKVPEGAAILALHAEGHRPFTETLRLAAGQNAQIRAELVPIPADMRVVSIPAGARVYVNNEFKGESPVTLNNLPPGDYRIRGELPGYEPTARTVQLANGASSTEELRLESNSGMLAIATQPAGIKVYIDGEERGTTSSEPDKTDNVSTLLTIDSIPVGEREVTLVATEYYPLTFKVTINKNETTILQPQKLERKFIPDLQIRTGGGIFSGVYLGTMPNGDVRLEVKPGIVRTIPASAIIGKRPLQNLTFPE